MITPSDPTATATFDPAKEQHIGCVLGIGLCAYRSTDGTDGFLALPGDDPPRYDPELAPADFTTPLGVPRRAANDLDAATNEPGHAADAAEASEPARTLPLPPPLLPDPPEALQPAKRPKDKADAANTFNPLFILTLKSPLLENLDNFYY